MELEDELERNLKQDESKTFYEKSGYGYSIILRIEQIEEGIHKGPEEASILNDMNVTPLYLKQIVQHYSQKDITSDEALSQIGAIKTKTSEYLIGRGYDYRYYQLWEEQLMHINDKAIRDYKLISIGLDKMKELSHNGVSKEFKYQIVLLETLTEHMLEERITDKEKLGTFEKAMVQLKV